MNRKEVGNKLELYVSELFKRIYQYARPTKSSGARGESGDVQQPYFVVECKYRNTENITLKEKVWKKLNSEIPINSRRLPLYILRNKNNYNWAVLKLEDFIDIFNRSLEE